MAYVSPNIKSRKALKDAVARGDTVTVFSPGPFDCKTDGEVSVEGPHYPAPHSWYARVAVTGGVVTKVVG